jgi:L-lactate dehydrogenase complex protein LldG
MSRAENISGDKEEMLSRIRVALGQPNQRAAPSSLAPFESVHGVIVENPVEQFSREMEKNGGNVVGIQSSDEVLDYLKQFLPAGERFKVALSDSVNTRSWGLGDALAQMGVEIIPPFKDFQGSGEAASLFEEYKQLLLQADVGVTTADYAIADTGTLVLVSGGEQHRLISLVPPIHVCLLEESRIVPILPDLLARVHEQHCGQAMPPRLMTFITGPSRTADIELTLVTGVHGPTKLHVLILRNQAVGMNSLRTA